MDAKQSHYNINVAVLLERSDHYQHLFDVNEVSRDKAIQVYIALVTAFLQPDFNVSVTYWDISGKCQDWSWEL